MPSRCKTLVGNFERMGIRNSIVTNADSAMIGRWYNNVFDLVVVDAPCSGEGMFRKSENAVNDWSVENVLNCALRQEEILNNIAGVVKPGGCILYSTCTFSIEENEMNVDRFLRQHPDFELCKLNKRTEACTEDGIKFEGCNEENIGFTRRFYPYKSKGEGQFMALMRRKTDGQKTYEAEKIITTEKLLNIEAERSKAKFQKDKKFTDKISEMKISYKDGCRSLTKEESRIVCEFLQDILDNRITKINMYKNIIESVCINFSKNRNVNFSDDLCKDEKNKKDISCMKSEYGSAQEMLFKVRKYNNNIVLIKDVLPVPDEKVFSCGVKIGEIVRRRLVPHHQFFMAYGEFFNRKICLKLEDEKTAQYICGMGFECPAFENGWAVVLVNDCSVGGVKIVNGFAKNHYPKGLRM